MGTGVNTGTVIVTKKAIDKERINRRRAAERTKRADICLECDKNNEGFCSKHNAWCGRVNYICLGIKNPYEYRVPTKSVPKGKKSKKKPKNRKRK